MLKRQLSHESIDSRKGSQPPDDSEGSGRRSKRLKKGIYPYSIASHVLSQSLPYIHIMEITQLMSNLQMLCLP